jgi:tetratricopeptide (TPR) repeat protein
VGDCLYSLGTCNHDLGQTRQAIDFYQQALASARSLSYRYLEAMCLVGLGEAHGDLRLWDQAAQYCSQAVEGADATGIAQLQSGARRMLAQIQLLAGDLAAARQALSAARDHDYPLDRAALSLLSGVVMLRQDQPTAAAREFSGAVTQADQRLEQTSGAYRALNTKALALCGLALTTNPGNTAEAATVFAAARAITSADGIIDQTLALFDALAVSDRDGILTGIRPALTGDRVE